MKNFTKLLLYQCNPKELDSKICLSRVKNKAIFCLLKTLDRQIIYMWPSCFEQSSYNISRPKNSKHKNNIIPLEYGLQQLLLCQNPDLGFFQ